MSNIASFSLILASAIYHIKLMGNKHGVALGYNIRAFQAIKTAPAGLILLSKISSVLYLTTPTECYRLFVDSKNKVDSRLCLCYRIFTMNDNTCQSDESICCDISTENRAGTPIEDSDIELALLAKALGHPARVAILRLLIMREGCVCGEICDQIPLAQSTISQHLKMMKEAGLIQGEVEGPRICYCVNFINLQKLKVLITAL